MEHLVLQFSLFIDIVFGRRKPVVGLRSNVFDGNLQPHHLNQLWISYFNKFPLVIKFII